MLHYFLKAFVCFYIEVLCDDIIRDYLSDFSDQDYDFLPWNNISLTLPEQWYPIELFSNREFIPLIADSSSVILEWQAILNYLFIDILHDRLIKFEKCNPNEFAAFSKYDGVTIDAITYGTKSNN